MAKTRENSECENSDSLLKPRVVFSRDANSFFEKRFTAFVVLGMPPVGFVDRTGLRFGVRPEEKANGLPCPGMYRMFERMLMAMAALYLTCVVL